VGANQAEGATTPVGPSAPTRWPQPLSWPAPTAAAMDQFGRRLAAWLQAGDLIILSGELGAGKTVLAQGIGAGLQIRGPIISPTFVLVRSHPSLVGGPALVHVDAYRLTGAAEVDDLGLEDEAAGAVTVVEWGRGLVEQLADDRLDIEIERSDDPADETRRLRLTAVGERWAKAWDSLVQNLGGGPDGRSDAAAEPAESDQSGLGR